MLLFRTWTWRCQREVRTPSAVTRLQPPCVKKQSCRAHPQWRRRRIGAALAWPDSEGVVFGTGERAPGLLRAPSVPSPEPLADARPRPRRARGRRRRGGARPRPHRRGAEARGHRSAGTQVRRSPATVRLPAMFLGVPINGERRHLWCEVARREPPCEVEATQGHLGGRVMVGFGSDQGHGDIWRHRGEGVSKSQRRGARDHAQGTRPMGGGRMWGKRRAGKEKRFFSMPYSIQMAEGTPPNSVTRHSKASP